MKKSDWGEGHIDKYAERNSTNPFSRLFSSYMTPGGLTPVFGQTVVEGSQSQPPEVGAPLTIDRRKSAGPNYAALFSQPFSKDYPHLRHPEPTGAEVDVPEVATAAAQPSVDMTAGEAASASKAGTIRQGTQNLAALFSPRVAKAAVRKTAGTTKPVMRTVRKIQVRGRITKITRCDEDGVCTVERVKYISD